MQLSSLSLIGLPTYSHLKLLPYSYFGALYYLDMNSFRGMPLLSYPENPYESNRATLIFVPHLPADLFLFEHCINISSPSNIITTLALCLYFLSTLHALLSTSSPLRLALYALLSSCSFLIFTYILQIFRHVPIQLLSHSTPNPSPTSCNHSDTSNL